MLLKNDQIHDEISSLVNLPCTCLNSQREVDLIPLFINHELSTFVLHSNNCVTQKIFIVNHKQKSLSELTELTFLLVFLNLYMCFNFKIFL